MSQDRPRDWSDALREKLALFVDGELGAEEMRAVEESLRSRPELQKEVDAYRRSMALMRRGAAQAPEVTDKQWDEMGETVRHRIETDKLLSETQAAVLTTRPSRVAPLMRYAAAAMVLLAAGAGAWTVKEWMKPEAPMEVESPEVLLEQKAHENLARLLPETREREKFSRPVAHAMTLKFLARPDAYQKQADIFGGEVVDPKQFTDGKVLSFRVGRDKTRLVWIVDECMRLEK